MEKSKLKSKKAKAKGKIQNLKTFDFLIVVFTFYFLLLPFNCCGQSISSTDLINNAKQYDGQTIAYEGEVIGDVMARKNFISDITFFIQTRFQHRLIGDRMVPPVFAWVNVNDGNNAIGIWVGDNLAKKITYTGSYKFVGDTIFVEGEFNRACLQHGGDLDIHANSLTIVEKGYAVKEKINIQKIIASLAFLVIVLFLGLLRILRRRVKKR